MKTRYYAVRQVKGGIRIGLKVWYGQPRDPVTNELLDRHHRWQSERDGEPVDIVDVMLEMDGETHEPVIVGTEIDEAEYLYMIATAKWARQHAPDRPEANPKQKIDPLTAPLPF